ncbi:MAG: Hsp33 family molecular chaperone HslO [Shewanella sp.]
MTQNTLYRYLFDNADVRGELVQLQDTYQNILSTHEYPQVLQQLIGELVAATSLLTATLKFEGDIGIQLQGNGPVSMAVVNANHQQELRGVARWDGELADDASLEQLFGQGYMVITLTPTHGERYQGVVALDKPNLAACLEEYFAQSEQLPTAIWLFTSASHAAGIMLQVLPSETDENTMFEHLCQLTATIKADEILHLDAEEVLHRLYHQEQVRLFDPVAVSFKCTCSRERSANAIRTIEQSEINEIVNDIGYVELGCEYCNSQYRFDAIDVAGIYSNHSAPNVQ